MNESVGIALKEVVSYESLSRALDLSEECISKYVAMGVIDINGTFGDWLQGMFKFYRQQVIIARLSEIRTNSFVSIEKLSLEMRLIYGIDIDISAEKERINDALDRMEFHL